MSTQLSLLTGVSIVTPALEDLHMLYDTVIPFLVT